MSRKSVRFVNEKIKNRDIYKNKNVTKIDDIDVNEILFSKEEQYGTQNSFKYFNGYNDNDVIRLLYGKLPQLTGYHKKCDDNVRMTFKISDKRSLKKCNRILKKTEKLLKIESGSKPIDGDVYKYMKTIVKIYAGSMITNFQSKKMLKEKAQCKINNNDWFCYQSKEKVSSSHTFGRMEIWTRKNKKENFIDDDLEKSEPGESDSETESDINNGKSDE